jgi:hypothetical protein
MRPPDSEFRLIRETMMRAQWKRSLTALFLILAVSSLAIRAASAADADLTKELRAVFQANLDATQKKELHGVLATVHSKSPTFAATVQVMQKFFEKFDVKTDLLSFKYIATDGEYAIARTKFKTVRVAGPPFRDNLIDAFCIFKKDGNDWKIWQQSNLEIIYPEAAVKPAK